MAVEVGALAPDFELRDTHRQVVRLSDVVGEKNVVLVFLPAALTRTCTAEACALRDAIGLFQSDTAQLLAVTVDSVATLRRWSEEEGLAYPLLSDFWPHGRVATLYGVLDEQAGTARRATFVIDRRGIVRWKVISADREPRDPGDYRRALEELDQSAPAKTM